MKKSKMNIYRYLVKQRQLSPVERLSPDMYILGWFSILYSSNNFFVVWIAILGPLPGIIMASILDLFFIVKGTSLSKILSIIFVDNGEYINEKIIIINVV